MPYYTIYDKVIKKTWSNKYINWIDLHLYLHPLDPKRMMSQRGGESSEEVAGRVLKARIVQKHRFATENIFTNAEMNNKHIEKYCVLSDSARETLTKVMERLDLSMRAFYRIIRVARTIADLDGTEEICAGHIIEAAGYRFLDRQNLGQ